MTTINIRNMSLTVLMCLSVQLSAAAGQCSKLENPFTDGRITAEIIELAGVTAVIASGVITGWFILPYLFSSPLEKMIPMHHANGISINGKDIRIEHLFITESKQIEPVTIRVELAQNGIDGQLVTPTGKYLGAFKFSTNVQNLTLFPQLRIMELEVYNSFKPLHITVTSSDKIYGVLVTELFKSIDQAAYQQYPQNTVLPFCQ